MASAVERQLCDFNTTEMTSQQGLWTSQEEEIWRCPSEYPELHGYVGLDLETYDPYLKTHGPGFCLGTVSHIIGISVAYRRSDSIISEYFPIRHAGGNLSSTSTLYWLRGQLRKKDLTLFGFNYLHDVGFLEKEIGEKISCKFFDSGTAAPLLDETRYSYTLEALSRDWLKDIKSEKEMYDALRFFRLQNKNKLGRPDKGKMHLLHSMYVSPYAKHDAVLHLLLGEHCQKRIFSEKMEDIFNLETRLLPCLLEMRRRGVRVDVSYAVQEADRIDKEVIEIAKYIRAETGVWLADAWDNNNIISKILDKRGIKYGKTPKSGAPQISGDWLASLDDPICRAIVRGKRRNKNANVFLRNYILGHATGGRVHCQFNPLKSSEDEGSIRGAITGRFSSSNFNLQNLPSGKKVDPPKEEMERYKRSLEIGEDFYSSEDVMLDWLEMMTARRCFLPEEGERWAAIDFSSQEPRLSVDLAYKLKLPKIEMFYEGYHKNPKMDFHAKGAELTKLPRKRAKDVTLGIMYCMGKVKLCKSIKLPTVWVEDWRNPGHKKEVAGPEGEQVFTDYHNHMPWVKELSNRVVKAAEERGWIRTILKRVRHFQSALYPQGEFPHKALNAYIQGSAADQMKKSMADMYDEGIVPLVTVHDENGLSYGNTGYLKRAKDLIENSVPLSIPVVVDVEVGNNWGEAFTKVEL